MLYAVRNFRDTVWMIRTIYGESFYHLENVLALQSTQMTENGNFRA